MYVAAERARAGDVAYFESLTPQEWNALIVGKDEDGRTLLHTAAANGHLDLLELIASHGAAKVVDKQDDEVLHMEPSAHTAFLTWVRMTQVTSSLFNILALAAGLGSHSLSS